jgi:two-component system, chemotaxis family, protein-glutamate methylesterase/glutaminase
MAKRDIIVVGASAGGLEVLQKLVAGLPRDLRASVFIVLHTGPDSPGLLGGILDKVCPMPVETPNDHERIQPGKVYVAKPDRHLIIEPGTICLSSGPKENRFRPAIDALFRSAAQVYGPRVVGVILSGGLDDGTAGLWAIKQLGGTAIVQDPNEALYPSMPKSAMQYVDVDYCVPIAEIPPLIVRLSQTEPDEGGRRVVPKHLDIEVKIAKQDPAIDEDIREIWEKSSYTCPECHGVLLQLKEGDRERFRCHTGHAFSSDSLLAYLTEGIEESLWTTIRNIEESVMLMRHMARHMAERDPQTAEEFLKKADEARLRSEQVRKAVLAHEELNVERIEAES